MQPAEEGTRTRRIRMTAGQRRETILEAATEVFAASGYRAGKVSDVAARIGVTEPVVFQNFGSKAALFAAVLDRLADAVRASLDDLAGHYDSAASLLAHIVIPADPAAPHGPGAPDTPHGSTSHGALFADAAALVADPEAGEVTARVARIVADHLADLVRRGQGDGSVRGEVNPSAAAWLILSVLATRPLRAGAAADADLERDVDGLALRAILVPDERRAAERQQGSASAKEVDRLVRTGSCFTAGAISVCAGTGGPSPGLPSPSDEAFPLGDALLC